MSTSAEDSLQQTERMVSRQCKWNSLSEAKWSEYNFHLGCEKKVSGSFTSTDNSPLLEIEQEVNKQKQLLLNN